MIGKPRECQECGDHFAPKRHTQRFCGSKCQKLFNNRRAVRGAMLYDLFMSMRNERDKAKDAQVWTKLCRLAQDFKADDDQERDGRASWQPLALVLDQHPELSVIQSTMKIGR